MNTAARPIPSGWQRMALLALAIIVLTTVLPVVSAPIALGAGGSFVDDENSVHEADIEAVAAAGITKGCGGEKFCPNDPVTRGQMAAFLHRVLKGKVSTGTASKFSDVPSSNQFAADIAWLSSTGITKGCGTTKFCPNDPVTREQMAAFLRRALGNQLAAGQPLKFKDVSSSNKFAGDIAWLSSTGVTKGCGDNRFCPRDHVTRGQMASFLTRALGLKPIKPETVAPPKPPASGGGSSAGGPTFNSNTNYHNSTVIRSGDLLSGHSGWNTVRISSNSGEPRDPDDGPFPNTGTFRVFCQFSHQNFDDPIVFPGKTNPTHLHTFFGNKNTKGTSTAASIAGGGYSTCQGGTADRSAYWIPSVYDTSTGKLVKPNFAAVYYQSAFGFVGNQGPIIDPTTIQPIPDGLMILAGKASTTPGNGDTQIGYWGCFLGGGAPTNQSQTIPDCPSGSQATMIVNFPQCWDGKRLTSSDQSHMAYPTYFPTRGCPSTHPVAIPRIMLQVLFPIGASGTSGWNLTSDNYPKSQRGGASIHADFVNGWDKTIMNRWLNNCIRAVKDCERSELGNGDALTFSFGTLGLDPDRISVSLGPDQPFSDASGGTWSASMLGVFAPFSVSLQKSTEDRYVFHCGPDPTATAAADTATAGT